MDRSTTARSHPAGTTPRTERRPRILLVASSGGHLVELIELAGQYDRDSRHWVTFDKYDARVLLAGESVEYAYSPTNRHIGNLIRNCFLAFQIISRFRPDAMITTGPGLACRLSTPPGSSA